MKKFLVALFAAMIGVVGLAGTASATGNHDWRYDVTCQGVSGDRPNKDSVDSNIKIKNLDTNETKTFNYHGPDNGPKGPFTYRIREDYKVPASWTHFEIQWVQVNGTNYHWQGKLECGGTAPEPDPETKDVTLCHYTGTTSNGKDRYNKITVPTKVWYKDHKGHAKDIWEAFKYRTEIDGNIVSVSKQGNTDLLAFDNCKQPDTDEKITVPEGNYVDKCGTENDVDLAVKPGTGYTVGPLVKDGQKQSITVTTTDGYVFTDGTDKATISHTFSNESAEECDLPETGLAATYNTPAGYAALGLIGLLGTGLVIQTARRRRVSA